MLLVYTMELSELFYSVDLSVFAVRSFDRKLHLHWQKDIFVGFKFNLRKRQEKC